MVEVQGVEAASVRTKGIEWEEVPSAGTATLWGARFDDEETDCSTPKLVVKSLSLGWSRYLVSQSNGPNLPWCFHCFIDWDAGRGWMDTVGGVVVMNRKNLWGLRLVSRNISWGISSVGEGMPWRFSLQICRPFWGGCHDCVWEFLIDNFGGNSVPGYDYFLRGSRPVSRDMELVLGRAGSCWGWSWEGAVSCYPGEYWEVIRDRGVQREIPRDKRDLSTTPH